MRLSDNRDLLLIDNEYAGWNPMAMDLAVYINETMIDNSHPGPNGVKQYIENYMDEHEQARLIKTYMKFYFDNYMPLSHKAAFQNQSTKYVNMLYLKLKKQVWECAVLNNFFWGVWALALLNEETCVKEGIFNYEFALCRCNFFEKFTDLLSNMEI